MADTGMEKETRELNRNVPLSIMESDAIGEILNISMGAAATAISTMLERTVNITTPTVSIIKADEFECESMEPAVGIEIQYVEGLSGSNFMVMKRRDIRAIVNLLLAEDGDIESDEELDELHLSAVNEIMNQMMGASSTAMATFFGKEVNISTPKRFDIRQMRDKVIAADNEGFIVSVRFVLRIENLLDSEFITVMPVEFTKELVENAISLNEPEKDVKDEGTAVLENHEAREPKYSPEPPAQVSVHKSQSSPVNVKAVKLPSFDREPEPSGIPVQNQTSLGLIMGVPLEVSVEIGRTRMPVKDILEIRQGSLVELDKQTGDPVDIIVNGQLIARGDVVTIDDNFGVRITEIISDREQARRVD